jgi:hypothetical protein
VLKAARQRPPLVVEEAVPLVAVLLAAADKAEAVVEDAVVLR